MAEEWRIVPSEPHYLASSEGRIMVVPFVGEMPNGRGMRQYGGQPGFGIWDKETGRFVTYYRGKNYKVHRLICEAFNGPPFDGAVCMHLDENAANNKPDNLKWGTQKENLNGEAFIDYCKARVGVHSPTRKGMQRKIEKAAI